MKSQLFTPLMTFKACLLFAIIVLSVNFVEAQNCNSELTVRNNFNARSIDADGASFVLVLTNNSLVDANYALGTEFTFCSNMSKGELEYNNQFPVGISFGGTNNKKINSNQVTVPAKSSEKILLTVSTTPSTPINTFSCLKVYAKNAFCNENALQTNLQIIVPDSKGE